MSAWYIVDDLTSQRSILETNRCQSQTQDEAILEAKRIWNALSAHDQNERDAFYVCYADENEDGEMDWETTRDVFVVKDMDG